MHGVLLFISDAISGLSDCMWGGAQFRIMNDEWGACGAGRRGGCYEIAQERYLLFRRATRTQGRFCFAVSPPSMPTER